MRLKSSTDPSTSSLRGRSGRSRIVLNGVALNPPVSHVSEAKNSPSGESRADMRYGNT